MKRSGCHSMVWRVCFYSSLPLQLAFVFPPVIAVEESALGGICTRIGDCDEDQFECIDKRCMCNPLWGHTGPSCDILTWTSWCLVFILSLVSVVAVAILAAAAKNLSPTSSKCGSGLPELAGALCGKQQEKDSGSTTARVVSISVMFDIISYTWKVLTSLKVISHATSAFWNARIIFPLSEGLVVLPAAIVISVWMDVANNSLSRSKSKQKLGRTKKVLQLGTATYILLLLLLCILEHIELAMVVQLGAIGIGLTACGSGAAKLCNTLRDLGKSSADIADNVFKVSRSMGIALYFMFIGNTMLLASRTRKSNTANLALVGITVSSLAKCFLNKAIFEYMMKSARAKMQRKAAATQMHNNPLSTMKPMVHLVSSLRILREAKGRNSQVAVGNSEDKVSVTDANAVQRISKSDLLGEGHSLNR